MCDRPTAIPPKPDNLLDLMKIRWINEEVWALEYEMARIRIYLGVLAGVAWMLVCAIVTVWMISRGFL